MTGRDLHQPAAQLIFFARELPPGRARQFGDRVIDDDDRIAQVTLPQADRLRGMGLWAEGKLVRGKSGPA
ncbi:hypothetical protein [Sphingomonas sp. PR090111-T3T-6A]|uniref:hypothetical protein n=1 Tax=Sphingomonas sp. PR090111-T3T-6A TaxID=685778 RepID=UPI001872C822|nr:hypothetical protein [Sphingomonas sp. PR090111-T3T-6A]